MLGAFAGVAGTGFVRCVHGGGKAQGSRHILGTPACTGMPPWLPVPISPLPRAGCSFHSPSVGLGAAGRPVLGLGRGPSRCASRTQAVAHALCCPTASLECRLKERRAPENEDKVTVSCDDGWTLTGCNAVPQSSMGAYAVDNSCLAPAGPGSSWAMAMAICCRRRQ
ncbi:proprotein convertase subtilisin/kexin type 9 [Cyanistes caeruleus]|uniref:proprotein convertase subtilisin/kexin type 9 n=1 Tax=Cyanistes caeruleus TaxID=156563 RepID=UPI000CDB9595|nr:proprotein convertase subtilisin/kexin type 9 [Cyanistes caeruleus]